MRARRKNKRQAPPPEPEKQEDYGDGTHTGASNGICTVSEMDGRTPQGEEKDGFPIARPQAAGELEAVSIR